MHTSIQVQPNLDTHSSQDNENSVLSVNNKKKEHRPIFRLQKEQQQKHLADQKKAQMIARGGDQRRIPSMVIVDQIPQFSKKSATTTLTNHIDNQQSESTSSVEQKNAVKRKVSPGSGRLLPYVPKRYVVPRVPAGLTSPSASSSSATTAKRVVKEVSFEDDDLDDGTDINAPVQRLDTFDETDEYVNDESGVENTQDTNGEVSDVSGVIGDGVSLPLPAILRDYLGPAPSTASDITRKRGEVMSPAPQDDIERQLLADISMGPLDKEFDLLMSSMNDTRQIVNHTSDGISNTATNVELLSTQADTLANWETQFSTPLDVSDTPYQNNRDRRITSDISTTIDTYGTYQRGPANQRTRSAYNKLPNYFDQSQATMLEDDNKDTDININNQSTAFYEDDFLTESEKQRLSYLRSIGTTSRGFNGSIGTFNRRTSDSLIDTSYHHSNLFAAERGILTPNFDGSRINRDLELLDDTKDILENGSLLGGGLPSTKISSQYNGNTKEPSILDLLDQQENPLEIRNRHSILPTELTTDSPLSPFGDVSCKYF